MRTSLLVAVAVLAVASLASAAYFKEEFGNDWSSRWVVSDWKKSDGTAGVWKHSAGSFYGDAEADKGTSPEGWLRVTLSVARCCTDVSVVGTVVVGSA